MSIVLFFILIIYFSIISNSLAFEQNRTDHQTLNSKHFKKISFSPQEIKTQNQNRLALVIPQFTSAAYQENGFYTFYEKYKNVMYGINVTKDLTFLSVNITGNKGEESYSGPNPPFTFPFRFLSDHFSMLFPSFNIDIINDVDVHNGLIFNTKNFNDNKYDVIILGHQEYVTQKEYNYLKTFVSNGGLLILLDSNVFYAEVKYDPLTDKVNLVKGHGWGFNGKSAWKDVKERWADENTEWIGSNSGCARCEINFLNMPFDYKHREEQNITNTNVNILFDYEPNIYSQKIAAYVLLYGKGKVISFGIYGDDLIKQYGNFMRIDAAFLGFLDRILLNNIISS